jgi:L,D-peptidoglycan transpeptidase YkuD (ErfK/YbiS/YcfS/YnhG family)
MIIINKYGLLKYKNLKFKCALGKAGIGEKKKEGDFITPKGKYKIIKVYYRADRIKKIKTNFRLYQIKKNMGWCDDPLSKNYNKLIKLPSKFGHEKLYRKDKLYDLILILNYNFKPIIKNKGSAIFIHIANKNYKKTMGCIGLKKKDLIFILKDIKKNIIVKII